MRILKAAALLTAVAILSASAADKVGYLNMDTLFTSYYKTVNANISFEQKKREVDDRMGVLRSGIEEIVRELKKLEAEAQNELLADSVREEALKKYRTRADIFGQKREEFERARQESLQELRRIQVDTEALLVGELTKLVKSHAAANGFTHIVDISGQSMNRIPFLLVYPEKDEITQALVALANQGHEKELEESKAKLEELRNRK